MKFITHSNLAEAIVEELRLTNTWGARDKVERILRHKIPVNEFPLGSDAVRELRPCEGVAARVFLRHSDTEVY